MGKFIGWLGGIAVLSLCGGVSQAGILSTGASPDLNATSVPAPGAEGYVFYNTSAGNTFTGASISVPVSFVSIAVNAPNAAGPGSWTNLTIAGTPTETGLIFINDTNPATMATITLADPSNGSTSDGAPIANFQLGLLLNTGGIAFNYSTFTLLSSVGDNLTITPQMPSSQENDFYFVDVEGGTAGETITIDGNIAISGHNAVLGGLTFDSVASVPEPASLSILGLAGGLLLRRRARAM